MQFAVLQAFQGYAQKRADLHALTLPCVIKRSACLQCTMAMKRDLIINKAEGLFLFGTGFLIRHQIQKVYKNSILYSVYPKFKENICLNLFFFPGKHYFPQYFQGCSKKKVFPCWVCFPSCWKVTKSI